MSIDDEIKELERVANVSVINEAIAKAANEYERAVVEDSISANMAGYTFAGNHIDSIYPFTDWYHDVGTYGGWFHKKLRFENDKSIEFVSEGKGFYWIKQSFERNDYIAPHANTLSPETMADIEQTLIQILFEKL